jgi:uncharacterized protein (TIGR00730 family)
MILTVFGGSAPRENSVEYEAARRLGAVAARSGWTVATGGYIGVMEAVSRGAAESGGNVIGVTCRELDTLRPTGANPWVREERKFDTLRDRLGHLVDCCDAAIAMPGGVGTLAEISIMWNGLIIHSLQPKPLVLIGEDWKKVIDSLFTQLGSYVNESDRRWISFAENETEGFNQVCKYFQNNPLLD